MKKEHLSQYFSGVAAKRLRDVEVNPRTSNQHEFNGVNGLRAMLGEDDRPFRTIYMLVDDTEESCVFESNATWYDARRNDPARGAEYRLYYPATPGMEKARPGDLLVVAKRQDDSLLVLVIPRSSTAENQVRLLFGLHEAGDRYEVRTEADGDDTPLGFVGKQILEAIGIDVQDADDGFLEELLRRFDGVFPSTRVFSEFARTTLPDVSAVDGPDDAIDRWMTREEILFRTLERHIVGERLRHGFGGGGGDVDDFIAFSLSVQNRRKSRVGLALENHLEAIFKETSIKYSRNEETEHKARPDFLFPGVSHYRNPIFPATSLTVLGVKSTCKDRWRQVLSEAQRIEEKHLFTLEPGISENQTAEMQSHRLRLVVPAVVLTTYTPSQRAWLMNLKDFIDAVYRKQRDAGI